MRYDFPDVEFMCFNSLGLVFTFTNESNEHHVSFGNGD